jgi:predicted helicase
MAMSGDANPVFEQHSRGVATCRDAWVYNFDANRLTNNVKRTVEFYESEAARWKRRKDSAQRIDDFVEYDEKKISWSETLKKHLAAGNDVTFSNDRIRRSIYRPYCKNWLYFDRGLIERVYGLPSMFPDLRDGCENPTIWVKVGSDWPMFGLAVNEIPDLLPQGGSQCFSFYTYEEDGSHRRENITDWALNEFRTHYNDQNITKWDIFHYVYAVLHHPEYRERYAANLKRELPRIPFVGAKEYFSSGMASARPTTSRSSIES